MIPAAFDYVRAGSLEEALALLAKHGEDAKLLAGGHSLLPAMKLRLAQPRVLIDIGRLSELNHVKEEGAGLSIGALTTHAEIERSELLAERCPLLPETAAEIGDLQVRNRGTLGGSLAHADPASDWPAAILALEADIEIAGPAGRRTVSAEAFFVDLLQTALRPGEILTSIRVPATGKTVAYAKFAQKASGFALAGAACVIGPGGLRVGITGVAGKPYRAKAVEKALSRKAATALVPKAAERAAEGVEPLSDLHASAAFRAHLAGVMARRAIEKAMSRA